MKERLSQYLKQFNICEHTPLCSRNENDWFSNVQVIKKLKLCNNRVSSSLAKTRWLIPFSINRRLWVADSINLKWWKALHIQTLFSWRACGDVCFRERGWKTEEREQRVQKRKKNRNVIQKLRRGGNLNNERSFDRAGTKPLLKVDY